MVSTRLISALMMAVYHPRQSWTFARAWQKASPGEF
jgi:hypothetical protein